MKLLKEHEIFYIENQKAMVESYMPQVDIRRYYIKWLYPDNYRSLSYTDMNNFFFNILGILNMTTLFYIQTEEFAPFRTIKYASIGHKDSPDFENLENLSLFVYYLQQRAFSLKLRKMLLN